MKIKYPFGSASEETLSASGAQDLTINNQLTIIDGVTNVATAARTLNLTIGETVKAGAELVIKTKTTAVEDTIFGTGMQGVTYAGVAAKTKVVVFVYDGTEFIQKSAPVQID